MLRAYEGIPLCWGHLATFFFSAIAASRIAGSECLSFHCQVRFRINIGCVKRNVAQPCPDCIEINASTKQVGGGCMAAPLSTLPDYVL